MCSLRRLIASEIAGTCSCSSRCPLPLSVHADAVALSEPVRCSSHCSLARICAATSVPSGCCCSVSGISSSRYGGFSSGDVGDAVSDSVSGSDDTAPGANRCSAATGASFAQSPNRRRSTLSHHSFVHVGERKSLSSLSKLVSDRSRKPQRKRLTGLQSGVLSLATAGASVVSAACPVLLPLLQPH